MSKMYTGVQNVLNMSYPKKSYTLTMIDRNEVTIIATNFNKLKIPSARHYNIEYDRINYEKKITCMQRSPCNPTIEHKCQTVKFQMNTPVRLARCEFPSRA